MKPTRLSWIDYGRGIAIILVVYRHVFEGIKESGFAFQNYILLEYANIFFYSFRMPLFFIISGIFLSISLSKRGLYKFVETRVRMILYPYFLWGFLQITLQIVFSKYTNGHEEVSSYLHLFYLPREIAQFWYLYALFNVSVLYAFSIYLLKLSPIHNIFIGLIFFYFSTIVYQENIKIGFVFDILHNYIFVAIGDLVSRYLLDKKNQQYFESGKILSLMLVPFLAVQAYFLTQNLNHTTSKYMFVEYYEPLVFLIIAITGCMFIINLTFYLQKKNTLRWLTVLGEKSLYIYVAHVIAFVGVRIILSKFMGVENVLILLVSGIVGGILIPLLLQKLSVRLNMPWIFTLEKVNKKEVEKSVLTNFRSQSHEL